MGETKTESGHPHSWAFAKPDNSVMKAPPSEAHARRPEFSQCFGDKAAPEELTEADLLTTVEFEESGDYLATGDRGGRVVIFEKGDDIKQVLPCGRVKHACKYKFYNEFQSHEGEFDYLKSLEIEEKINQIKWCRKTNGAHFLLSSNDKTIKLWKIQDRKIRSSSSSPRHYDDDNGNCRSTPSSSPTRGSSGVTSESLLRMPRLQVTGSAVHATPKRVFSNVHAYHINSLSANSDGQTFISADDLRINLWSLENSYQAFNIVDIKPVNMDELNEVITSASFHPQHCHLMMYSSSRGAIRLADMRDSALCERYAKVFEQSEDPSTKSFFSEIISSISDVKFSRDGRYLFSRDYLTLKVWDTHMESAPVSVINIHEHLRGQLCDLYETDSIFDKFSCAVSGDGRHVATGSYNNVFQVHEREGRASCHAEISRAMPRKRGGPLSSMRGGGGKGGKGGRGADGAGEPIAFDKKIMHLSWHPTRDVLAIAGLNRLYFYTV